MNKYEKVWCESFGRFYPPPPPVNHQRHTDVQCLHLAESWVFLGAYADPRYERIIAKRSPETRCSPGGKLLSQGLSRTLYFIFFICLLPFSPAVLRPGAKKKKKNYLVENVNESMGRGRKSIGQAICGEWTFLRVIRNGEEKKEYHIASYIDIIDIYNTVYGRVCTTKGIRNIEKRRSIRRARNLMKKMSHENPH